VILRGGPHGRGEPFPSKDWGRMKALKGGGGKKKCRKGGSGGFASVKRRGGTDDLRGKVVAGDKGNRGREAIEEILRKGGVWAGD